MLTICKKLFTKFNNLFGRLLLLIFLIMVVFSYAGGRFIFVKASNNQINIFPGSFTVEQQAGEFEWKNIGNAFYNFFSSRANFKEFSGENTAYIHYKKSSTDSGAITPKAANVGEVLSVDEVNPEASQTTVEEIPESIDGFINSGSLGGENNEPIDEPKIPEEDKTIEEILEPTGPVQIEEPVVSEEKIEIIEENNASEPVLEPASEPTQETNKADEVSFGEKIKAGLKSFWEKIILPNKFALANVSDDEEVKVKQGLDQGLIFSDFALPLEYQKIQINDLELRLSLAAQSTRVNDKLLIAYNIDGAWRNLETLDISHSISNGTNGDFFRFSLPILDSLDNLSNLKIKISYLSDNLPTDGEEEVAVYLDSLWLEAEYGNELNRDENPTKNLNENRIRKNNDFNLDLLSIKTDFKNSEIPGFNFNYQRKKNIAQEFFSAILGNFRDEYKDIAISAQVKGLKSGRELIKPEVRYVENGSFDINFPEGQRQFKPGKYELEITIQDQGKTYTAIQDFTWGVLAFNVNKSIYLPDEKAYLQMGVLDDSGDTLCNVEYLNLQIKEPSGQVTYLTTENGLIISNPECGFNNVINTPDFYAFYQVKEAGTYAVTLTARTPNGEREVNDTFEVRTEVPFEIERTGPTRIFPKASYQMIFKVKANQDYKGDFTELVPKDFIIPESKDFSVAVKDDYQEIVWHANWRSGEIYELKYDFDAPDISPEFYLLGPAKTDNFAEIRQWQVASDAITEYVANAGSGATWTNPTNAWDNSNNTYASRTIPKNGANDSANYLLASGNNAADLGLSISKVEIGIEGYMQNTAVNAYLVPVFSGTTAGTAQSILGTTIGTSDSGSTFYVDVTSDAAGPGASNWTWTNVMNLDVRVYGNNPSTANRIMYVDQIRVRVTYNTAPTGSVNSILQKTNGSGIIDFSIEVDDAEDDNCRAKVEYVANSNCDFTTPLDPSLSDTDASTTADFGDPDIDNNYAYQVGTTTNWIITSSGSNTVDFDWDTSVVLSGANGTYCFRITANDGSVNQTTPVTATTTIDNLAPTSPGALTFNSKTDDNVVLNFGYATTETNFREYKIFYKPGTSGVTESGSVHASSTDADLGYKNYNGTSNTTISGLEPDTDYVFNIWAYDQYGNKASSTEMTVKTETSPRAKTVEFLAGNYSGNGTTGQNSDTNQTFSSFDFNLVETGVDIKNAYIVFNGQFEAYADNAGNYTGYNLSFDTCQDPCTVDAFAGSGRVLKDDNNVLAYDETGSNQVKLLLDVTNEVQMAAYGGSGTVMKGQVGYRFERGAAVNSIAVAKAKLVITYTYDADSPSITNTVIYPLESTASGNSGSRLSSQAGGCALDSTCPLFNYDMDIPEYASSLGAARLSQWFQTYNQNDGTADVAVSLNIQGTNIASATSTHEAALGGGQGNTPVMYFNSVSGFAENTDQSLEYYFPGADTHYLIGGEVAETYTASSSASTKTRTVSFPIGVLNNGLTGTLSSGETNIYFPENGRTGGKVAIKKAWFRIITNNYNTGANTITVSSKTGNNATSSNYVYNYNVSATVAKPSFNFIHVIPDADYAELQTANAIDSKTVKINTQNSNAADQGGTSVELMITYAYTSEVDGYLSNLRIFAGQSEDNGNSQSSTSSIASIVMPESTSAKTVLAGALLANYLVSDSDTAVANADATFDANLGITTPTCTNAFNSHPDSVNSFTEFYKNIASVLTTTDAQSYIACYSNNGVGDTSGGAKMGGQLIYTYKYYNPPTVSASANTQTKSDAFTSITNNSWTDEDEVVLFGTAADLSPTSNEMNFYFQLIASGDAFDTSAGAPTESCLVSTAYGDCSSKIWTVSDSSGGVGWYNEDWGYRKKLIINAGQVIGDQIGFPVFATTTDSDLLAVVSGGHVASSTGGDILVTDSNGTTLLNFEKEYYSPTTGEIALWIKTDLSSTTNKELYLYYGNAGATTDLSTTTGVWDSDYLGVWHMDDTSGSVYDSTGINTGTNNGATENSSSGFGYSLDFDGVSGGNYVDMGPVNSYEGQTYVTFEASFKLDGFNSDDVIFAKGGAGEYYPVIWRDDVSDSGRTDTLSVNITGSTNSLQFATSSLSDTNWHHLAIVFDGASQVLRGYLDGQADLYSGISTGLSTFPADDNNLWIGSWEGSTDYEFDGMIAEARISKTARSANWIKTQYNNQKNASGFVAFSTYEDLTGVTNYQGDVNVTPIPNSSTGYKWQVKGCNNTDDCSAWSAFDTPPNFKIDDVQPTAPGNLTLSTSSPTSLTLSFGSASVESNFVRYRIFYKAGLTEVDENDTELVDSDLNFINYNGTATTTISNLESDTQYVINIWVYDAAGNKNSATELVVSTAAAAHARTKTVMFHGGDFSGNGTTGQNTDTNQTFAPFNFKLAETGVDIKNAYIIFEAHFEAYADNAGNYTGYNLSFDSCEESCTASAFSGSGAVTASDNSVLVYNETTSGNKVRLLLDVTNEAQLNAYAGNGAQFEGQIGYNIKRGTAVNSIAHTQATLVVTYAYDGDNSTSLTNTVVYPLESTNSGDSGSRGSSQVSGCTLNSNCPLFNYNMQIPESSSRLNYWFEVFDVNAGNSTVDMTADVNIQGSDVNSDLYTHESALGATQGNFPKVIFDNVFGFAENTDQSLEYHISGVGPNYLMGGEVVETYLASSSAAVKTRTVSFPIGYINNGNDITKKNGSVSVYFPENGGGTGVVDIKKAWFRIKGDDYNAAAYSLTASSKVGDNTESSNYIYNLNVSTTVINPSFSIIHIIPNTDYAELEEANLSTAKTVTLYTTNSSVNMGGVSAELMITYTYTDEAAGYLTSVNLFGGQSNTNANSQSATFNNIKVVFPETRGTKTLKAAGLFTSYLFTDSDGNIPGTFFTMDANISATTPTCSNVFMARTDAVNTFSQYYKNVFSSLSALDDQNYNICITNTNGSDTSAGAKMNAVLSYTYQWQAPPSEFTQNDWRWYDNYDGLTPTTAKASENNAISQVDLGETLRLRMNVGVAKEDLAASNQSFKLQYGIGTDCSAVSSWSDVGPAGGSGAWIGYNNPDPVDGDALPSSLITSSNKAQSYEESNSSIANVQAMNIGQYGEWDWVIYNNNATSSSNYCFRMVKSDGTELDDYLSDSYPKLTTNKSNMIPSVPGSLTQYRNNETTSISNGSWINEQTVKLTATATDPNISELITLYFEFIPFGSSFTTATSQPSGACTYGTAYDSCGSKIWFVAPGVAGDYRVTPYIGTTSITSITESASGYKWQVIACDDDAECNNWVQFGSAPNVKVDVTPPTAPGSLTFSSKNTTSVTANFGDATTEINFVNYKIFYKAAASGVTESDTQHTDTNLNLIDYNSAATTQIPNLSANTQYVFNIWAYDAAGNKATATTELVVTTDSSYTPPTGSFLAASQKSDGSGAIDLVIEADDPDNNDTLRSIVQYVSGAGCDFSSPLDPYLDETDANITADFGDPDIDNNHYFQVGTSTGWIMTSPGANQVSFDWLSKSNIPSANGTYCLAIRVNDGMFDEVATHTKLVIIDNVAPTAPGALTLNYKDYNSVSLKFGGQSSDPRFSHYKIFYKPGTSGVSESDSEHTDSNLSFVNYNGAASTTVNNLSPNTQYVFNIWAYDTLGNRASSTSFSAKTNALPANISASSQYKSDRITSISNGGWTNDSSIVLTASVHDQDEAENITFYYQLLTNAGSFATATSVPSSTCSSGTSFSACTSKIWEISTSTYALPTDWYNKDWLYRKRITINSSQVVSTETDFPVLATTTDSDLAARARSDGYDILFTASDGTTTLPYEREYYNSATGQLAAWIKTNISSTTNTIIYMYYGNVDADDDNATTTGAWNSNFNGIWHLEETVVDEGSFVGIHTDSTGNKNANQYGNNEMTAYIYRGQEFDGGNDYISIGNTGKSVKTVSFWVKPNTTTQKLIDLDGGTNTISIASGVITTAGFVSPTIYVDGIATTSINTQWHQITITTDTAISASNVSLGVVGGTYLNGLIDEVEFSDVARSATWIRTHANSQKSVNSFLSFASESRVTSFYESVLAISIPDASTGYKWQTMACDDDGDCSSWGKFNTTTPNFKVDVTAPANFGPLSLSSRTSNSITLALGSAATENNFSQYKIFYSSSTPVSESDTEHSDSDLNFINFNGTSNTTVTGLDAGATYYFNIWAYDLAGNKASSTAATLSTSVVVSSPGVMFYTKNSRTLYYKLWTGSGWGNESVGPTLGSAAGDNIRHIRAVASDDRGKMAILVKTWDGTNQEWWGTVYRYAANDFVNSTQLGTAYANATNNLLITGCLAPLSGGEFMAVRNNNGANGTLVYSWSAADGWVTETAGPNPGAVLNGCSLERRPGTDNYLLMTYDDGLKVGSAYYYGGSTYANSWTTWTGQSTVEYNGDNYIGRAYFDPSNNTRGAFNYSNSAGSVDTQAKFFVCDNSSINYGSASTSPSGTWPSNFVDGEFATDPTGTGVAYYLGQDSGFHISVAKLSVSTNAAVWSSVTNGVDMVGTRLYSFANRSQKPYAIDFYKGGKGLAVWSDSTNLYPYYRVIDSASNSIDSSSTAIPGADSNVWTRIRIYNDPNEDESLVLLQNDDVDYSGVFWDGSNNRFYNTTDNPGSNQVWTELVTAAAPFDTDDENVSFAFSKSNSAPNSPTSLAQYKNDGITSVANTGWVNQNTVKLKASVIDPDTSEIITLYLQLVNVASSSATSTTQPASACASTTPFDSCTGKIWAIASSTAGDYSIIPFTATATISSIPDSSSGYKWQTIACDDSASCSSWTVFNATTPNFKVDTTAPTAPGNLTIGSITSQTVTLTFGSASAESNFSSYKIFYKQAASGVTELDTEHTDADLNFINYNGTTNTIVTGLSSSTQYVFNIWAYDLAGNKATATIEIATTTKTLPNLRQTSYLFENDDAVDVNSNTDATTIDTSLTNLNIGERLNVRFQIENNGGDIAANKVYKVQYENQTDAAGTWVDVGAATPISYTSGLSGINGDIVSASEAALNAGLWINGTWHEGVNQTGSFSLSDGYYSEFVFALKNNNATANKTYRLRLYNVTDNTVLNQYVSYPTITTIATQTKRFSKASNASLLSTNSDLTYYLDPKGYSDVSSDNDVRDNISASANYTVYNFFVATTTNTNAMTVTWNGQSSVNTAYATVYLQVYKYGSPNQWVTMDSENLTATNTDFTLSVNVNSSLSSYYDGSYWTYWRVYQAGGTQILRSDYFNIVFSAPIPEVGQKHYRWRYDNGSQTTATWRDLEDEGDPTGETEALDKYQKARLRFDIANTGGGSSNYAYRLEYATSTGSCTSGISAWTTVPANSTMAWQMATSTNYADGDSTTAQLANSEGYTFTAGKMIEDPSNTTAAISLTEGKYTEIEYAVFANSNAVAASTYCFRVTNAGTALDSYTNYPIISLAGNTNTAPYFSVGGDPSDGGSSATNPTNTGSDITFTATAQDDESDDYYLAICKTNAITAGNDGPPTCTGGNWCISGLASSTNEASCSYNAADSGETLAWYAFTCDKYPGFSIAKCSASSQGGGDADNDSPFIINHPPVFSSVSTVVPSQNPGSIFTISTVSSESDSVNGNDTMTLYVCSTNSASPAGCAGTTICSEVATTTSNAQCSFADVAPTPPGVNTYYAFLFDNHGLGATSNSRNSNYTINNVAPNLGAFVLNGGAAITPNLKDAEDKLVSAINTSVTDSNGCSSLVSATAVIYMSNATGGYNCAASDNDCYQVGTPNCVISDCSGADDQEATYTCTTSLKYFAIPTDNSTGNTNEPYNWLSRLQVYDGTNYSATTSTGVELNTTTALNVIETVIDFGSDMFVGENTGAVNSTTTVENFGNSPIDTNVLGTNMTGVPSGTINVNNIEWSLNNFTWSAGTDLALTNHLVDIVAPRATSISGSQDEIYWALGIPFGSDPSAYTGQNTFSVVLDSDNW